MKRRCAASSLTQRDSTALAEFAKRVRAALGANLVELTLFGSKALGRDTPESDIDVAVIVGDASTVLENEVIDMAFDVNLTYGVYVSPRLITRDAFEHPVLRITDLLRAVERDGVAL